MVNLGDDEVRGDCVDPNSQLGEVSLEILCKAYDGRLGCGIRIVPEEWAGGPTA